MWSQIILRRHSEFSLPQLVVLLASKTSLRFTNSTKPAAGQVLCLICAWGRARTGDPFLFREMLYQLSYPGV